MVNKMYTAVDVNVTDEVIGILRESVEHHGWIGGRFQVKDSPKYRLRSIKELCDSFSRNTGIRYEEIDYSYSVGQNPPIVCVMSKWYGGKHDIEQVACLFQNIGFDAACWWNKDRDPVTYTLSIWTNIKSDKIVKELQRMDNEWQKRQEIIKTRPTTQK